MAVANERDTPMGKAPAGCADTIRLAIRNVFLSAARACEPAASEGVAETARNNISASPVDPVQPESALEYLRTEARAEVAKQTYSPVSSVHQPTNEVLSEEQRVLEDILEQNRQSIASIVRELAERDLSAFEMHETLGTGSFSRIKLATLESRRAHKGVFAMKVMQKGEIVRLKQTENAVTEKNIMQQVRGHPFIVRMYRTFQDNSNLYMLLEYVPGGEIFALLRKNECFSDAWARFYIAQLTLVFEHLHRMNIVYRDTKPENFLLDKEGYLKIVDFGFAKQTTDVCMTVCGTPEYLAPEILLGKGHGAAVDWWSTGIFLYELLHGMAPFYSEDLMEVYQKILVGASSISDWACEATSQALIMKLLTGEPSNRLGSNGGAHEVKSQPYFDHVDFAAYYRKEVAPPMIPTLKGDDDTSCFDSYDDDEEDEAIPGSPVPGDLFVEY